MKIKYFVTMLSVFLIIVLAACTFNNPVLPNWETIWEIPLPEISFEMSEAIDNEFVFADTTSQGIPILSLSIKDTVEKEGIRKEDLSIKPDPDTLSTTIEDISISSPGTESSNPYSIHQLLPYPINVGDTVIVPDTTLTLPSQIVEYSNYKYVYVNEGELILVFNNETFLTIKQGMQIEVWDDSSGGLFGRQIGTAVYPQIGPYNSASDTLDLKNTTISNKLRLEIQVPLQQNIINNITSQDTSGYVNADIIISNLTVSEAKAQIPVQTAHETGAESVEDRDNHIIEAVVDEGQIHLNIENQLEVEATVIITLPNFEVEEEPGIAYTQSEVIPALSNNSSTIELDDLTMYNFKSPGMVIDSLHYEVTVITTPSSGLTHISNQDSVIVRFDADSIFFREFEGVLDTVEVAIDTVKQEDIFDYNGFEGGVRLEDLQLELAIFNEIGIPVDMVINIRGEHRNPDTGQLDDFVELDPVPIQVIPGESGMPSTNLVTLNGSNSRIVELMEILPTDIVMSGRATIMGQGKVTINDSVWGEYEISSPFNIFVDSIPDFESDIDTLDEIDVDIKDAIENRFQNANLELDFENGLPLAANVIIIFATDTTAFFELDTSDTNKLIIDDFKIVAGTIGSDGYVSVPFTDQISTIINYKELKIFSAEKLYFGSRIEFPEVNKAMKFRSTDAFIGIGSMKFKVFMNPDE
ncbi:MAG: hypothetical protein KAS18_00565 [Calditrichia bacterium]|nr:hypothetical protein [Calditrichia bacterium]